jgi:hypothetical protein
LICGIVAKQVGNNLCFLTVKPKGNDMSTRFVTGVVRASYANIMRAKRNEMNGKEEYSVVCLVPKTDTATVEGLKAAAKAAIAAKWPAGAPKGMRNPMRDGDTETKADGTALGAEYQGCFFFNAKTDASRNKPSVIDKLGHDLIDPDAVVSGDFIRVSVNAYAYDAAGNRGVSFGLNNVLLDRKGEPLGGSRPSAAQDFGIAAGAPATAATATADDDWS